LCHRISGLSSYRLHEDFTLCDAQLALPCIVTGDSKWTTREVTVTLYCACRLDSTEVDDLLMDVLVEDFLQLDAKPVSKESSGGPFIGGSAM